MAESITEGTLKQWLKQKGDYVEADEEVATIETDKVRTRPSLSCPAERPLRRARQVPRPSLTFPPSSLRDSPCRSTLPSTRLKPVP